MCIYMYMLQLKNDCSIRVVPISILGAVQIVPLSHTEFLVWFFDGPSVFLLVLTYRTDTCACVYRPLENSITRSYSENYYTPDMVCSVIHFFCFCVNMCVQYERKSPSVLTPLQCYTVCVFTESLFPNTCPCFDMPPLSLPPSISSPPAVCDDHVFKDDKLFYRFRKDDGTFEEAPDTAILAKGQRIYGRHVACIIHTF